MLITTKEMLRDSREKHYAVPGFNCIADVMVRGILDRAEECRSPVVLMLLADEADEKAWWYFPSLVRGVAERYSVPVAMHLDHATDPELIRRALDEGFTSVMFDGSSLPFAENVEKTHRIVEMARPYGASVEAELGLVGGFDLGASAQVENRLTEPDEVVRFVDETGVDLLAVSIGTAHGVYTQLPQLDIPRLVKLNAASQVPLVLHGGSGTPEDQIRDAVRNGICKMNIYADNRLAMWRAMERIVAETTRKDAIPQQYFSMLEKALGDAVEEKIHLLGSANRC